MEPELAGLRAAAAGGSALSVAERAALRRQHTPELVALAVELGEARRRAAAKFGPEAAAALVADREGVEMASSAAVARHKARRFAEVAGPGARVVDLCCGIGGDAMALREAGLEVVGLDADPVRAWMCGVNAGCRGVCGRVEDEGAWSGVWFHLDPPRRTEGAIRVYRLEDLSVGPEAWRGVIAHARSGAAGDRWGGAIKLGPGVEVAEIASALGADVPRQVEYISEHGRMSQAVVWVGRLAGAGTVRATALRGERTVSVAGEPAEPRAGELGSFVFEADDALERAGLLGAAIGDTGARAIAPGLGLLTGDRPARSEWFASFELLAHMPWNEKRVRAWLRGHDGGIVEVKTRAGSAQPEALQHSLRGDGGTTHTLFVLRIGRAMEAFITRRIAGVRSA